MTTVLETSRLSALEIPLLDEGQAPEWIHVFPKGQVMAYDGRGPFFYEDASAVIAASFDAVRRIHIDANHATETAAKIGGDAPAHGFITEMEERENGIWAKVDWNDSGKQLMANRSYWGVSPVFRHGEDGRVSRIKNVALTNDPALTELQSIASAETSTTEGTTMDFLTKLAALFGLKESASEDEVYSAAQAALKPGEGAQTMSALAATFGLQSGASEVEIKAAATALAASAEKVATLTAKVETLTAEGKQRDADAWLQGHITKGRAVPKGEEATFTALHAEDPERAEKVIKMLPVVSEIGHLNGDPPSREKTTALSADQQTIAQQLGISAEDMLKDINAGKNEGAT